MAVASVQDIRVARVGNNRVPCAVQLGSRPNRKQLAKKNSCQLRRFLRASASLPPKLHVEPSSVWFIARLHRRAFFLCEHGAFRAIGIVLELTRTSSTFDLPFLSLRVSELRRRTLSSLANLDVHPNFRDESTFSPESSCRAFRPR